MWAPTRSCWRRLTGRNTVGAATLAAPTAWLTVATSRPPCAPRWNRRCSPSAPRSTPSAACSTSRPSRPDMSPEGEVIFLTGATGFIGRHVLDALLGANYRVRALVRDGSHPLPPHPEVTAIPGDLRCAGDLVRSVDGCK